MADYKVPREVSLHRDFPRDAPGKLIKRELRDPYTGPAAPHASERGAWPSPETRRLIQAR